MAVIYPIWMATMNYNGTVLAHVQFSGAPSAVVVAVMLLLGHHHSGGFVLMVCGGAVGCLSGVCVVSIIN